MPPRREPNELALNIGRRIRDQRKAADLTQSDLAATLEVTYQQVQKYERGISPVSLLQAMRICTRLNTTLDELFGDLYRTAERTAASPRAAKVAARLDVLASNIAFSTVEAMMDGFEKDRNRS